MPKRQDAVLEELGGDREFYEMSKNEAKRLGILKRGRVESTYCCQPQENCHDGTN